MTLLRRFVASSTIKSLIASLILFVFNLLICGRLLRIEYLDQMQSIEGMFLALALYIQRNWPSLGFHRDWLPLWRTGVPFSRVYQPALHYVVAVLATATGLSVPRSYHILTAITYSLGAVAFYLLGRALGAGRFTAFVSSLMLSVFSPAAFLASSVRVDNGGKLYGRRLQAMVVYGEGPNVTGLMLALLALAALHLALQKKTALSALVAALAIALVPATSWPATMALAMGIVAYLLAQDFTELKFSLLRLIAMGLGAWAFASPVALLSDMTVTLTGLGAIQDPPTPGRARWIALALVFALMLLARALLLRRKASLGLRFAMLWAILLAGIVLPNYYMDLRLISNPARFHLAMELAIVLALCLATASLRIPRNPGVAAAALLMLLALFGGYRLRAYARSLIRPIDITQTLEYQEARWADANLHGGRFMAPGTVSLWLNVFTEIPQAGSGFDMSLANAQNLAESYLVWNGVGDDAASADLSLLWLKAYDVAAVGTSNEHTREFYHAWKHPDRFVGLLTKAWPQNDGRANDEIYLVPERSPGLARVVPISVIMQHPPANGTGTTEMRPFVNALDDPSLPLADFRWQDVNHAQIAGSLTRDEAIEVAMNYDRGWTATANGHPVNLYSDGLGFVTIEPACNGSCDVELAWSAGSEPVISWCAALSALVVALALVWRERRAAEK